jgi:hypothetical protein
MSPPFESPQVLQPGDFTPLFEPFSPKRPCGRPPSKSTQITSVNDQDIAWAQCYRHELKKIQSDPLAWIVQICLRRAWVTTWDALIGSCDRDAFEKELKYPKCWFNRFLKMFRHNPIVTIDLLRTYEFAISNFEELQNIYSLPGEACWSQMLAEIVHCDERIKADWEYVYFQAPQFASRQRVIDCFGKWLEKEFPHHPTISFADLQILGVVQWIDLRIFELTTGRVIAERVKLSIINDALQDSSAIRPSRVRESRRRHDLDTTRVKALSLLTRDISFLAGPARIAQARLIRIWKHTEGNGDDRFCPAMHEIPLKIHRYWEMRKLNEEKERADLRKLSENIKSSHA